MRKQIRISPDTKITRLGGRPPRAVLVLLVQQIGFFLAWAFADAPPWIASTFATSAERSLGQLQFWQPLTALWFHLGTRGLLLNMLSLWIFGSALEQWWGQRRFVFFWCATGVGGLILGVLVGQLQPTYVMAGSAGSAVAMMVAFAMIFPDHMVFFYGLWPLKAKHLSLVLLGFILLGALFGGSYLEIAVQLGGGLLALLLLWWARRSSGKPRGPGGNGGGGGMSKFQLIKGGKKDEPKYWN